MERNIIILQEMYKTVSMGMLGIDEVKDKLEDKTIKKEFIDAKKKYQIYEKEIVDLLNKYYEEPKEINELIKISNDLYTDMKLMSATDSKIVKMMMQGTNSDIIKLQEIKNNEPIDDDDIEKLLNELLELFEYQIRAWKKYL